jgi:acyl carrier protein
MANTDNIKAQVRAYIVDNFIMGGNADHLKDGDSFMETHVVDSTGFLELVSFIEETYGFSVTDDDMVPENLDSLDNIDAYVRRQLAAA